MAAPHAAPRIGLALGGGGARGLAHILILEALDEMGLKPACIAGTSIGALFGAAYAARMSAAEIREHTVRLITRPGQIINQILRDPKRRFLDLLDFRPMSGVLIDGESLAHAIMPADFPTDFAELEIPFIALATDFYGRCEMPLSKGPLITAIAASMALPGLISPQNRDGCLLVDGGITNPLPFDHLSDVDITIAVDVTGRPIGKPGRPPSATELWFRSAMIMQHLIVQAKIERKSPDILIRPDVDHFRVLDFRKSREILKASEVAKAEFKTRLSDEIEKYTGA